MVIGVTLGVLGLLGLGGFALAKKGVIGGSVTPLSTTSAETISENSKEFASRYAAETVVDSSTSPQPFISSPEMMRPSGDNDGKDKDFVFSPKTKFAFGSGAVAGWLLGSDVDGAIREGGFNWGLLLGVVGAYVAYKVLKDG